jgi:TRAP-type C4-dicarboxylate transport system permease large subunit
MLIIVGLVAFLAAGLVAVAGTLGNAGADHPPTEKLAVFGYHPTGSTGTLFLLRIVIGVVASLFVGAHRSARNSLQRR